MFERIWGVLLALAGLLFIGDGWRLGRDARPDGMFDDLGPDRYIILLGFLLVLAGLVIAIQARPAPSAAGARWRRPTLWPPTLPVVFTAVIAAYALLTPILGYTAATFLFFLAAYGLAGRRRWLALVALSAASAAACHVVFVRLSDMPLPRGWFGV